MYTCNMLHCNKCNILTNQTSEFPLMYAFVLQKGQPTAFGILLVPQGARSVFGTSASGET